MPQDASRVPSRPVFSSNLKLTLPLGWSMCQSADKFHQCRLTRYKNKQDLRTSGYKWQKVRVLANFMFPFSFMREKADMGST